MDHIVAIISDPNIRTIVGPVVGSGLSWAIGEVRKKFSGAPPNVQVRAEENAQAFADLLADKVAEKIRKTPSARVTVDEELNSPKGIAALQKAVEVASEVDDDFTRENLADLVSTRLTTHSSRAQLAIRLAAEAIVYLNEQHLRLLAFMISVQAVRPNVKALNEIHWTKTVERWLIEYVAKLVVPVDHRDLSLIASIGIVDVQPGGFNFDLKQIYKSPEGYIPQIDPFLTGDATGKLIKERFTMVMLHRLNFTGQLLATTAADKITGIPTDLTSMFT